MKKKKLTKKKYLCFCCQERHYFRIQFSFATINTTHDHCMVVSCVGCGELWWLNGDKR